MILADRHHADLLYSLQRLFEDRLNVGPLFVPVGYEWWDEGYWQFGKNYGDRRLADQFLAMGKDWTSYGEVYATRDRHHPERTINGITLDGYRGLLTDKSEPSLILASVPENAPGFKRLADEVGARFIYHVGNAGQHIDWSLDPVVLATTSDTLAGPGVSGLHQEIDSERGGAFGFRPMPADTDIVRNFVNCFSRTPGFADFREASYGLLRWQFTSHGHDEKDGFVYPVSALGDAMATAGWGWHDKRADGFGHVIHAWAAVGRPIIGHAGYYRDRLAGPLWEDGVTCFDLDARSVSATVGLMRRTSSEQLAEMGRAIRERFDSLVDYEAEAASVAVSLGL